MFIQIAPPTQPNTQVNKSKEWNTLTYHIDNIPTNYNLPPLPNFGNDKPLKFPPHYCYYTDGSFLPPQDMGGHWIREKAGYGIYNESKNIELAKRLPGLQNIFRAIHTTLKIITNEYPNEPAHIFTDCLNGLYNIKTQLKHPTHRNNHLDKIILQEIATLLQQRTQPTTLYKVRAHAKINGNEKADELAKKGRDEDFYNATLPHEFAHSTPYYFQKDKWPSMEETPYKGPIRFLEKHIIRYNKEHNLTDIARNFPNIDKWVNNTDIENELSNEFWTNKNITNSQKTCLLKLR
ncbi:MAG TPA: RNase H family protein [Candidatus Nitrosocosmicus sp.]|nr:RNase H family protein [Candidatus Nitrosocosmicus sp.]